MDVNGVNLVLRLTLCENYDIDINVSNFRATSPLLFIPSFLHYGCGDLGIVQLCKCQFHALCLYCRNKGNYK